MTRLHQTILAAAGAIAITGSFALSRSGGPSTAPSTQPVNKFCAVNRDHEVDPKVTYTYNGKVIGFCCEDCIPDFKKDPEKYLKDLK